jgi:hypothetical protein
MKTPKVKVRDGLIPIIAILMVFCVIGMIVGAAVSANPDPIEAHKGDILCRYMVALGVILLVALGWATKKGPPTAETRSREQQLLDYAAQHLSGMSVSFTTDEDRQLIKDLDDAQIRMWLHELKYLREKFPNPELLP